MNLTQELKQEALRLGFSSVGACPAVTPEGIHRFYDWLQRGYAGQMHYLPERAQVTDEGQWIHAVAQGIGAEAQRQVPVAATVLCVMLWVAFCTCRVRRIGGLLVQVVAQGRDQLPVMGMHAWRQVGQVAAIGQLANQDGQMVADLEHKRDQVGVEAQLAAADAVEHAFSNVGEGDDAVETE